MHWGHLFLLLLLLLIGTSGMGCAGSRIRAQYSEEHGALSSATSLSEATPGSRVTSSTQVTPNSKATSSLGGSAAGEPYQMLIRLTPQVLEQIIVAVLPDNLAEGQTFQVDNLETRLGRPRGPFGGLLFDRIKAFQKASPPLSLNLQVDSAQLILPSDCEDCFLARCALVGGLSGGAVREVRLEGQVTLRARLAAITSDGKPALEVLLTKVEEIHVALPIDLPGLFSNLHVRIEDTLRDELTRHIQEDPTRARYILPLGERFRIGQDIRLTGLGVRTLTAAPGELRLGLNTTLNARPSLPLSLSLPSLKRDWEVVTGTPFITRMIQEGMSSGELASRFDRSGRPEPEGPVALDVADIRFTTTGFEMDTRIWYLAFPAWWRDYQLRGHMELQNGQLRPRIEAMTAGAGDGATWMGRFVERRLTSERAAQGIGRALPQELPLSEESGTSLRLSPDRVVTAPGWLAVSGHLKPTRTPQNLDQP